MLQNRGVICRPLHVFTTKSTGPVKRRESPQVRASVGKHQTKSVGLMFVGSRNMLFLTNEPAKKAEINILTER